jgi:FlaA1/EpsC-like NDP-sugar epimerase
MIQAVLKLPRKSKQFLMLIFDSLAVIFSLLAAFSIRLDYLFYPSGDRDLLLVIFLSPLVVVPVFISFGLYRDIIRFMGFNAIWRIFQAVSFYSILWGLIPFMASVDGIPRSVILINWLIILIIVGGSRLFARWILSEVKLNNNVLIYGAGSAGRQLSIALNQSKDYKPVAFIDDAKEIYRQSINGLNVYSSKDLVNLIHNKNIKEVLLAIPSLSRACRNEIIKNLEPYKVVVRSLPSVSDLAQGRVKIQDLLEIDIEDLLGRDSVSPNKELLKINISAKVVLVTGAGGSIGSELCRQILLLNPTKIVLFEISESALYLIEQELVNYPDSNVEIIPVIGSVTDFDRMEKIFKYYSVNTVYHAAAYKHVPLVEFNQSQGVLNNSFGTLESAKAAILANVETFVLISTDKAVRPTNVMGASKRIAELILQAFAKESNNTNFTMVRFGNVLDSSGSVIPLFKKQIKKGGPLTVTHSDIVRYFMSIPEAVELVIQAGAMAKGGEVFVLDMGDPIRIYDLAVKMINLSGLQVRNEDNPNGDIEIKFTGLRPGEKLYEELLVGDKSSKTQNKLILRAKEEMISWGELEPILAKLNETAINADVNEMNILLKKIVPELKRKI